MAFRSITRSNGNSKNSGELELSIESCMHDVLVEYYTMEPRDL